VIAVALTRILQAIAAVLTASIFAAAWHDVSTTWDVWYYHLPFAARIWGIVPPEAYAFHATNQSHYEGFPLLAELLQGLFWRITGRPEAANLVAFGALAGFVVYLRRAYRVPLHLGAIGLLAVPLVQLHASSCYVDLPGSLCAAALILEVIRLYATEAPPSDGAPWRLVALAGGAANMRFQLHPVVLLALLAAAPRVLVPMVRAVRGEARAQAWRRLALLVLLLPLAFASPLKNAIVHHNPYYPMKLSALGITLPGREEAYSNAPPYLRDAPRPVRFAASVLEVKIRPFASTRRWTIDQWGPNDSTFNRMGGFFGAYVAFHLVLLGWIAARDRSREARAAAIGFAVLTAVTASLPQSHELRYYLYWMIVLVSLNLILASREGARVGLAPPALGAACALALSVVLAVTRCGYAYPSGSTFTELLRDKADAGVLERIGEGERACVSREPWTILHAATFHPPRRYTVQEAVGREDCGDARWLE
jgi:hypothetical protein